MPGYQNLGVGNTTSRNVTGLSANMNYYYRVRAYDGNGTTPIPTSSTQRRTGDDVALLALQRIEDRLGINTQPDRRNDQRADRHA